MSLLVLVITALRQAGYLKDVVTLEHYHIMGKWMLAFCVFWAYIGFGQYMLIWYANIPEETQFFITRNTESWWALSMLLVIGRFFIAFPDFAIAMDQKGAAPALYRSWMDFVHANARHVHHRPARVTRHRRARQHLGFAFPHRHRRNTRFRLSANCA